ncbi:ComEC/Rec2 family competence protein [Ureaplasma sp. ES3154-GEN]|uniref:ComEC/Rec2 family competence protein n=1 Tax=Ureaplasma sp. ES3154-GEN TaxID=2984844 RepID=UPI0021E8E322|nr:ComEC/Rec2 family competence protein [Ureaplasma sp. ES3154-GEN]MCV3743570.1 ComEC/Rec2 family competence protein [Ureaplasma sp. ES3154-GEN]
MAKQIDYVYENPRSKLLFKLLVLNIKIKSDILDQIYSLNIAHLFVVSGLHLSLILKLIDKIKFKHSMWYTRSFSLIFILFYGYLLDFNPGVLRVLINLILTWIWKNNDLVSKLSLNGIINTLICLPHAKSYVFYFSYGVLFIIFCLKTIINKRKIVYYLVTNLVVFIFTSLISWTIKAQLNILGIIYMQIFSAPILILHQLLFFLGWIPKINIVFDLFLNLLFTSVTNISQIDVFIKFQYINKNVWRALILVVFSGLLIIYKNQKKRYFYTNKS